LPGKQQQSVNKKEMIDSLPKGLQKELVRHMYAQEIGSKVPLFYYLQQHENLGNMQSEVGENQTTTSTIVASFLNDVFINFHYKMYSEGKKSREFAHNLVYSIQHWQATDL